MKLYSAIGIEDFSNPLSVQPSTDSTYRRIGTTDLFITSTHPSFLVIPTAGKGLNFASYASSVGFPLKDIIADHPAGDCWVALGLMVDPIALAGGTGPFFNVTAAAGYTAATAMGSQTRADLILLAGQGKRCCLEMIYKPSTGQYRIYVNGFLKQAGNAAILNTSSYPLAAQMACFNAFQSGDSGFRFYVTDAYFGVVDAIDSCLGNFKITKLIAKTSTLNTDGMTPGGAMQLVTGDHSVEFDTAPLAGQMIHGVMEAVRAASPGPTASVTTKRKVNGVETAARKATNLPITIASQVWDDLSAQRVMAPPTNYVAGTPLTECKLALSIVSN